MNLCDWKRMAAKGRESSPGRVVWDWPRSLLWFPRQDGIQDARATLGTLRRHHHFPMVINVPFSRQGSVAGLQWMSLSSAQNICPIWQFLRTEVLYVCGVVVVGGGGDIVSCVEIIKPITGPSKF